VSNGRQQAKAEGGKQGGRGKKKNPPVNPPEGFRRSRETRHKLAELAQVSENKIRQTEVVLGCHLLPADRSWGLPRGPGQHPAGAEVQPDEEDGGGSRSHWRRKQWTKCPPLAKDR
jgi:hypothetical protein